MKFKRQTFFLIYSQKERGMKVLVKKKKTLFRISKFYIYVAAHQ